VTEDVLGGVQEDAAIATRDVSEGETVTLELRDGLLHATPGSTGPATGIATMDAEEGSDVGVSGFEGIMDYTPGTVAVYQVPPVRSGGSRSVDLDAIRSACGEASLVVAAGVEALVSLRTAGIEPDVYVAAGNVAAAAASRGIDVVVVATADEVGRVTDPLREAGTAYTVEEWD
jgi:putative transcriptional regulator